MTEPNLPPAAQRSLQAFPAGSNGEFNLPPELCTAISGRDKLSMMRSWRRKVSGSPSRCAGRGAVVPAEQGPHPRHAFAEVTHISSSQAGYITPDLAHAASQPREQSEHQDSKPTPDTENSNQLQTHYCLPSLASVPAVTSRLSRPAFRGVKLYLSATRRS